MELLLRQPNYLLLQLTSPKPLGQDGQVFFWRGNIPVCRCLSLTDLGAHGVLSPDWCACGSGHVPLKVSIEPRGSAYICPYSSFIAEVYCGALKTIQARSGYRGWLGAHGLLVMTLVTISCYVGVYIDAGGPSGLFLLR